MALSKAAKKALASSALSVASSGRPVVAQILLDRRLVLRPHVGAELEERLRLLPLEDRHRPVRGLHRVVELPRARADLRHDAREPRLHGRQLVDRHVALPAEEAHRVHDLLDSILVHRSSLSSLWAAQRSRRIRARSIPVFGTTLISSPRCFRDPPLRGSTQGARRVPPPAARRLAGGVRAARRSRCGPPRTRS